MHRTISYKLAVATQKRDLGSCESLKASAAFKKAKRRSKMLLEELSNTWYVHLEYTALMVPSQEYHNSYRIPE